MGSLFRICSSNSREPSRGIIHFSGNSKDSKAVYVENNLPNPNPENYKILRSERVTKNLVIEIQYLDCKNYEGRKILVFENCTLKDLEEQRFIDPHFLEDKKYHSPVARFEPTQRGWEAALKFAILW